MPGSASLDRIYATDLYLGSDTQKLVVVDNLCIGPFENIAHIKDPHCHRATCFSMSSLSSDPKLVGEVLDIMPIPSIEFDGGRSWNGVSILGRS